MNAKAKGTRAERRAIAILEAQGYTCTKSGGSLGVFDLVAIGPVDVRLVQVKSGTARLSRREREAITSIRVMALARKECWTFRDRVRAPVVEVLGGPTGA